MTELDSFVKLVADFLKGVWSWFNDRGFIFVLFFVLCYVLL